MSQIALMAALLLVAPRVQAQTWTGLGVNSNWSTAGNWDSVLSSPSSGSVLHFAGAVGLSSNVDALWTVNGITFDAANSSSVATGAFTLGGSALTLNTSGGIVVNGYNLTTSGATIGVGTATVNNAITLGAAQTWQTGLVSSSLTGNLTVNGTVNNGGFLLTTNAQKGTVLTLGGIVSGAGGLTTSGLGTTTVSGANTYTGVTTVANGTLSINTLNNIGSASSATGTNSTIKLGNLTTTGTLQYTGGATTSNRTLSLDGTTGGGTIASSGSGALTLTGAISGSTAGAKTLTLTGNNTNANTVSGTIADGSAVLSLAKSGSGTWVLNGANSYTGSTTLNSGDSGTLTVNSGAAISTGALIVNGGTLNLGNATQTVAGLSGSGGTVSLGTGTTLTSASTGTDSFYGVLSGSGNLTKTGAGTLALGGSGTNGTVYSGTTLLSAGTLAVNSATALGTGTLKIENGTTLNTTGAAPVKLSTGNAITFNGSFTFAGTGNSNVAGSGNLNLGTGAVTLLSAAPTITVTSNTLAIGGVISNGGGSSFTKAGAGALTLSGANNFTGGVTLSAGTLNINNAAALGSGTFTVNGASTIDNTSGSALTVTNAQAWSNNVTFTGTNNLTLSTGNVALGANLTVTTTANALAIERANAASTTTGIVSGNFVLTKAGAGALTLSGANTFGGGANGLVLNAGTVNINNAAALGAGTFTIAGGAIDNTSTGNTTVTTTNAQLWNGDFTYAGANNSNLTMNGGATMNATRTLTVNQGTLTEGGIIAGATFGLTKAGAGTLVLSGANTFSGVTTLAAGTLRATTSASALGAGSLLINGGSLELGDNAGAGLSFNRNTTVAATTTITSDRTTAGAGVTATLGTLSIGAQTLNVAAGGNVTSGTARLTFGATTLSATGATFAPAANTLLTVSTIGGAGNSFTVNGAGNMTVSGIIGTTTGNIVKSGAGSLTLSAANTFSGGVTLNAGTIKMGNDAALGTGTLTANGGTLDVTAVRTATNALTFGSGATLTYGGTNTLSLDGAVTLSGANTLNVAGSTLTLSSAIGGGASSLTKTGAGTLTLTGASTYTGATILNAGTLTLDFSAVGAPANNILNSVTNSSALTLKGGTLNLIDGGNAANTQQFNGTNVSSGASTITLNSAASGVTAALNAFSHTAGATLNFNVVPDTVSLIATTTSANTTSGILGPWATVGTGTALQYASKNVSDQIISYAGATAATAGTLANMGSATTNYSYAAAATISGNVARTGDTLRYTGAASTTEIGSVANNTNTLTLNGLMNAGTGTLTIQDTGVGATGGLVIGGNNELVIINNARTTAISAAIKNGGAAGSVNFTSVGGLGTLILSGANTFSGGLTLNSGILRATTNAGALGAGTLTINGGTLQLADSTGSGTNFGRNTTIAANTTIQSDRTASAAGTTQTLGTLSIGANTLNIAPGALATGSTAGITFGATTLSASGATFTPALNSTLTLGSVTGTNTDFTVNGAGNAAITGIVGTGTGGIAYSGTGTLTLSGANTYSGNTTLSSGTLTLGNTAALQNSTLNYTGGTLSFGSLTTATLGGLAGTGNLANTLSGATGLTVGNNNNNTTYAGVLSGAGNLTKTGTGALTLSGNNTYTGAVTTLSGGTLSISVLNDIGIASGIGTGLSTSTATNAASLVLNGGTLQYTGATLTTGVNRLFTLGTSGGTLDADGSGMLWLNNANAIAFSGTGPRTLTLDGLGVGQLTPILGDNSGAASLVKNGTGSWTLAGLNTYTGDTTLNAGTLTVNSGSSIGLTTGTGNLALNNSSALSLNNAAQSVASLSGGTSSTLNLGAGHTLTDLDTGTHTFAGALAGAGNFTLNGSGGNLTLSGNNANLQGAVAVTAGTLIAGATNALGSGAVTVASGAALGLSGAGTQNISSLTLTGNGAAGTTGALFNNSANTNILNTNVTLGGATTITSAVAGGTLQIGASVGGFTLKDYFGVSGHTQPDEIGTVTLGSGNNLTFSGAGNITVLDRIRDFAGQGAVNTPAYASAGSVTINMTGTGTVTYGAVANTYTGTTNVTSGTLFLNTYNNAGVAPHDAGIDSFHGINGPLVIGNGGTATVKLGGDDVIASTAPLTLYSTGTFDLNNHGQTIDTLTFNHGGTVNFTGGGTLYLNKDVTFTASAGETAAINGTGGVISLRLLPNIPVDNAITDAIRTFTVTGTSTSNLLLNGNIQNGSLVKAGTGMLTLGAASVSDYTGMTIVNAGILNVQASTSGSKSSLGSGNGTDAQGTTVASGATLQIQGNTSITTERLNLSGTGYTAGAGALQSVSGANVWGTAGAITYLNLSGDARIQTNAGTLSIPTSITSFDNSRALTVGVDLGATTTISGGINTGSGSGTTLTKDGYGTLVLNPSSSSGYQGATNITQGILSLQSAGGLGAATTGADGTFVTSGAQLQLAGGISVLGEALTLNGTGYNNGTYNDSTGALRNAASNNAFAGTIALGGATRISAASGTTLTLSGGIDTAVPLTPSHKDLTILGNVTATGQVLNGSVTTAIFTDAHGTNITKVTGSGGSTALVTANGATVTRATGGTITIGGTAVDQTGTYNGTAWANASGNLTLGGGATSAVDGITLTLGTLTVGNGSGNTIVQSGPINSTNANNVLTITGVGDKVNAYYGTGVTEVFTGQLAGSGTFQKDGPGTLVFDTSFTATNLTLIVSGGEIDLRRNASNLGTQTNITFGTIRIIGNTILDFDSSYATTLSSSILVIDSGVTVTVNNWASETDFWMLTGSAGSFYQPNLPTDITVTRMALDSTGNSPQGRITFAGSGYTAASTAWVAWGNPGPYTNNEIRPIPEPATYGVLFFAGCLALLGWRRYSRRSSAGEE